MCTVHLYWGWLEYFKDDLTLVIAGDAIKTDAIDNHLENKIKRDKLDNISFQNLSENSIVHVWVCIVSLDTTSSC